MEEYKSNSHKSKELTKNEPTKKVVKPIAKATKKKKNALAETFISEDASNIKSYILMDVLVPAIKKARIRFSLFIVSVFALFFILYKLSQQM